MGWLFRQGMTQGDLIAELTQHEGIIMHKLVQERDCFCLWMLCTFDDGKTTTIGVALLRNKPGYGWGEKLMDETMGPAYYSCPIEYLVMASPPLNQYAKDWRVEVERLHQKRLRFGKMYDQWKEKQE